MINMAGGVIVLLECNKFAGLGAVEASVAAVGIEYGTPWSRICYRDAKVKSRVLIRGHWLSLPDKSLSNAKVF